MTGDLNRLAEQIGVAVEYLVDVYAKLAPTTWYTFGITLLIWLLLAAGAFYACRAMRRQAEQDQKENGQEGDIPPFGLTDGAYILAFVFACLFIFAVGSSFSHAVKATASPKAYALDQIVKRLK